MLSGSVNVSGSHPAVPGSNATFSCSIGLELIGPNSSMCAENGEWEPDPREVTCRGDLLLCIYYYYYLYTVMADTIIQSLDITQ